ncbi:Na+-driven multidrug efflux pump [Lachnospiraceae bacterium TWA4]|nr:Na+-driven multidrug efflux pump [Lachnospiraceae bacterium TWA4]
MATDHLSWLREGQTLSTTEQLLCIIKLSIPAIFAQISTVAMEYIDASMVGHLGATSSAAIGLVSSTTWLVGGISTSVATGFTVQVAHRIGAREDARARAVVRHGLLTVLAFGLLIAALSSGISFYLPTWLGGASDIRSEATAYFLVYSLALPAFVLNYAAGGMLQCSGNMHIPSILNIGMCVFDVLFNAVLIFPTRTVQIFGKDFLVYGANLGVMGASLGTGLAELVSAILMLYFLLIRSDKLHLRKEVNVGNYRQELAQAIKISLPIAIENAISGGAQVVSTKIVSPLGNISIAANSFSVTAEGLCYMPGYGIASAATALIGQSVGAGRPKETRKLSFLTVGLGMAMMTGTGILLYIFAPQMLEILSPNIEIQSLGVKVLRIEAFAEPFFAAGIVTAGVFRGTGKTLISTLLNLSTMWFIRLPLAAFLAPKIGLKGVWIAMCLQLIVCGTLFLIAMVMSLRVREE